MVTGGDEVFVAQMVTQKTVAVGRAGIHRIDTGLVQRHGVKARVHADIRDNGGVVFAVAVAVRADIHHQTDMEARPPVADRLGVLGNFAVQNIVGVGIAVGNGIEIAAANAAAAAGAFLGINVALAALVVKDGFLPALFGA